MLGHGVSPRLSTLRNKPPAHRRGTARQGCAGLGGRGRGATAWAGSHRGCASRAPPPLAPHSRQLVTNCLASTFASSVLVVAQEKHPLDAHQPPRNALSALSPQAPCGLWHAHSPGLPSVPGDAPGRAPHWRQEAVGCRERPAVEALTQWLPQPRGWESLRPQLASKGALTALWGLRPLPCLPGSPLAALQLQGPGYQPQIAIDRGPGDGISTHPLQGGPRSCPVRPPRLWVPAANWDCQCLLHGVQQHKQGAPGWAITPCLLL